MRKTAWLALLVALLLVAGVAYWLLGQGRQSGSATGTLINDERPRPDPSPATSSDVISATVYPAGSAGT